MNNTPENETKTDGCGSLPLATGSAPSFSAAYQAGYDTAKRGSFFRPNPYPTNREAATAWDRGYEAYQFEQRRNEARIKHAEGWANCRD